MAWKVALVLDTETDPNATIGVMPVWAQATPRRQAYHPEWKEQWNSIWHPEPGLTLFTPPPTEDLVQSAADLLPTIEEHHPNLFCIQLFGVPLSDQLVSAMAERGFYPTPACPESEISFARPFEQIAKEITLDASRWNLKTDSYWIHDFFSAFFGAVGAPEWHGRNFDALNDSICTGGINNIEVPYRIVLRNVPSENAIAKRAFDRLEDLFRKFQAGGCPVVFVREDA